MMSKKVKNQDGATALLEYLGTAQAEALYGKTDPSDVAAATNADTSSYNAIQKKSAQIIGSSKNIAQFLDRDTNPDFADNTVAAMIQSFFNNPRGRSLAPEGAWKARQRPCLRADGFGYCSVEPLAGGAQAPSARGSHSFSTATSSSCRLMIGIPLIVDLFFIWFPAIATVFLSFTTWSGIGGLKAIHADGVQNYDQAATNYPPFWPAAAAQRLLAGRLHGLRHAARDVVRGRCSTGTSAAAGSTRACSSCRSCCRWRSSASCGSSSTRPTTACINNMIGRNGQTNFIDWLGNPKLNLWAVLVEACWRQVGYVMVLYLAGLKAVDPTLREAAIVDGANAWQTFWRVVFPVLRPINVVILVVTVIESLRAFDLVYITNGGTNGLELLSVLITQNIVGQQSRIGFGSCARRGVAGHLACSDHHVPRATASSGAAPMTCFTRVLELTLPCPRRHRSLA